MVDYKDLGKRIREQRLKLNLTQEKLAEIVDISLSYMGQIERGERSLTIDTLLRLTNALGISIDYLLEEYIRPDSNMYLEQINQLMHGRNPKQMKMALEVLRTMLSHIDDL